MHFIARVKLGINGWRMNNCEYNTDVLKMKIIVIDMVMMMMMMMMMMMIMAIKVLLGSFSDTIFSSCSAETVLEKKLPKWEVGGNLRLDLSLEYTALPKVDLDALEVQVQEQDDRKTAATAAAGEEKTEQATDEKEKDKKNEDGKKQNFCFFVNKAYIETRQELIPIYGPPINLKLLAT